MKTMMLAAMAAFALPCVAVAETLGTIPVDPNRPVTGSFTADNAASTQSWRLDLEKSKLYALSGFSSDGATVTLKRAGGQTLALFNANTEDPGGVSFRAPYN